MGLLSSLLGAGGDSAPAAAPSGPVTVTHGDFVFGGKGSAPAPGAAPAWLLPLVIAASALVLALVLIRPRRKG